MVLSEQLKCALELSVSSAFLRMTLECHGLLLIAVSNNHTAFSSCSTNTEGMKNLFIFPQNGPTVF